MVDDNDSSSGSRYICLVRHMLGHKLKLTSPNFHFKPEIITRHIVNNWGGASKTQLLNNHTLIKDSRSSYPYNYIP